MEFLTYQLKDFLHQAGIQQTNLYDEPIEEFIHYGAAALGISTAAFLALCCLRCISPKASKKYQEEPPKTIPMSGDPGAELLVKAEEKVPDKDYINERIPNNKKHIMNLKRQDLRNFDDEKELASFYSWRESLSIFLEPVEFMESDLDCGSIDPMLQASYLQASSKVESDIIDDNRCDMSRSYFDKYYRDHPYLPPFVKNIDAVEKYTETMIAVLEDHKIKNNLHYTEDTLSFNKLMQLLEHDIVPFDVSPEKITKLIAGYRHLASDEMLEIMCRIYDMCLENKIAEWSLHYRKAAQPYFRNRHYRKQFQTRPVNDLLQDIQTYYNQKQ